MPLSLSSLGREGFSLCTDSAVHLRLASMKWMLGYVVFTVAAIDVASYTAQGVVAGLDLATRQQCQAQDWPAAQAQAHQDFCKTYLQP